MTRDGAPRTRPTATEVTLSSGGHVFADFGLHAALRRDRQHLLQAIDGVRTQVRLAAVVADLRRRILSASSNLFSSAEISIALILRENRQCVTTTTAAIATAGDAVDHASLR